MANPLLSTVAAAAVDIQVYGGDTMPLMLQFFEDDGSTPNDLTGVTLRMQVKPVNTPIGTPKFTWSTTDGTIIIGGVDTNEVSLANVVPLRGGVYLYDLQAAFPGGNITTLLRGNFIVLQDITDSSNER